MGEEVLVGLLFADRIITEKNGKKGIIGTFNRFHSRKFPVSFPSWAIYAAVTNLKGRHEFALNLVSEETNQVIVPLSGQFEAKNRTDIVELTPVIMGAVFPKPGKYNLTFHIDGNHVGARVLLIELLSKTGD